MVERYTGHIQNQSFSHSKIFPPKPIFCASLDTSPRSILFSYSRTLSCFHQFSNRKIMSQALYSKVYIMFIYSHTLNYWNILWKHRINVKLRCTC
jgi:hypothetical protein